MELKGCEFEELIKAINRYDDMVLEKMQNMRARGLNKSPDYQRLENSRKNIAAAKSWTIQHNLSKPWIIIIYYKISNWKNTAFRFVQNAGRSMHGME